MLLDSLVNTVNTCHIYRGMGVMFSNNEGDLQCHSRSRYWTGAISFPKSLPL